MTPQLPEAPGSWNGYFRHQATGNKDQFTLRQLPGQDDAAFIKRVSTFIATLAKEGWQAWNADVETGQPAPAPVNNNQPSPEGAKSFEVTSIKLAAGGDNPRWVVKGGNYEKYGVTCWPETLEAAGIANKMDPLKENSPSGRWIAHYIERQNDEGKSTPDKVVRLERIGN